MRYMMLIHHDEAALAAAPQKELWAEYGAFNEALSKAGAGMASGERLQPSSAATTVRQANGKTDVLRWARMRIPRNSSPAISSSSRDRTSMQAIVLGQTLPLEQARRDRNPAGLRSPGPAPRGQPLGPDRPLPTRGGDSVGAYGSTVDGAIELVGRRPALRSPVGDDGVAGCGAQPRRCTRRTRWARGGPRRDRTAQRRRAQCSVISPFGQPRAICWRGREHTRTPLRPIVSPSG